MTRQIKAKAWLKDKVIDLVCLITPSLVIGSLRVLLEEEGISHRV